MSRCAPLATGVSALSTPVSLRIAGSVQRRPPWRGEQRDRARESLVYWAFRATLRGIIRQHRSDTFQLRLGAVGMEYADARRNTRMAMETTVDAFRLLTNERLLAEVRLLVARERTATAVLVASLAEVDLRKLFLDLKYSS